MTYEKRSELRRECSKFLRLAYLADFIAMESLTNIINNSVDVLQEKIISIMEGEEGKLEFIVKDLA